MTNKQISEARVPRAVARDNALDNATLAAYREALRRYARKSWVSGVSIAMRERGDELMTGEQLVIAIHVRKKIRTMSRVPKHRRIPRNIRGVPTDVVEASYQLTGGGGGSVTPAGGSPMLRPGASIARAGGSSATLGALVTDQSGASCLLCTAHTLREVQPFKKGEPIVHPGPKFIPTPAQFATVARFHATHLGLDAGIARLEPNVTADNIALLSNTVIGPPQVPVTGRILEKSGARTQVTRAVVKSAIGTFEGLHPAFELFSENADFIPISEAGDSGAIWYDAQTGAAVGLHCRGSGVMPNGHSRAVATLVLSVLDKLKLTWV